MSTPHNEANVGDIADVVLMPGDPLRAKFIADTFLEDVKQFNSVRNMLGYTGYYKGKRISVMGSGMGIGSTGIYTYELYKFYNVEKIIRVGSAGAYDPDLHVYDIVVVDSAYSDSSYAYMQSGDEDKIQYPDVKMTQDMVEAANRLNIKVSKGRTNSSDTFYLEPGAPGLKDYFGLHQCVCTEMESFCLFHNAKVTHKKAATILTISDSLVSHEETTAKERESNFKDMMTIALESVL